MSYLFICYPKCSTCRKAEEFLKERGIAYRFRNIVEERPAAGELAKWIAASDAEKIELLASDGMLVKRPLLVGDDGSVRVGFRPEEWADLKA